MSAVLEFHDLRRSYRPHESVLDGGSLSLAEGEVVGLLGRNASAKTTPIHLAMGLLRPQGGRARV
ncbi:MAG: ABC transporter ATP-binding protein, partial [Planctomycetes bacterium]|nr:ABC transporter ATP-binding protein [Planctomycetota bacterium]